MSYQPSWDLWRTAYADAFRNDVYQLLAWGYADTRPEIIADHDETDITGLIARGMISRLDSPATDERFNRYFVADDTPQEGEGRTGRKRRRVDIIVENSSMRPRTRYILEAKRLRRGDSPLSKYLGDEGLGRFVRSSYAAHAIEAAMIGYVQSPAVDDWASELVAAIAGDSRIPLAVVTGLDSVRLVAALSHSWVGVHARDGAPNMNVYHVLLDCIV